MTSFKLDLKTFSGNIVFAMKYPDDTGGVWDGITRFYHALAEVLNDHDIKTFIAYPALSYNPIFVSDVLSRVELDLCKYRTRQGIEGIKEFIRSNNIKLIVFVDVPPSELRFDILKRLKVRTMNFSRWGFSDSEKPHKAKSMVKKILKHFPLWDHDAYIAVSRTQGARLTEWAGINPARTFIAENGIDVDRYRPGPAPEQTSCKLPPANMYILMACMARPEKNVDMLVDVCAHIVGKGLSVCFVYAGDGICKPEWEKKVARLGLQEYFLFVGHQDDLVPFYRLADIFVHASSREASPRVVMESLSMGLPVVASSIDPHREILERADLDWSITEQSIAAYSDKIEHLYFSDQSRRRLGNKGRSYALKYLRQEIQIDKVKGIILSVLGRGDVL